uniref:Phosphoglycerate mutase n=1 Tax=Hemiselmis andersenii TaxID=464988 RepID=A0A6U2IZN2_HEMAN
MPQAHRSIVSIMIVLFAAATPSRCFSRCFGAGIGLGKQGQHTRIHRTFLSCLQGQSGEKKNLVDGTYQVVLMRHGESEWNKERRFISWVDSPLTPNGVKEAVAAGVAVGEAGMVFDAVYTSFLSRAVKTAFVVLEESRQCHVPITPRWRLNERFVGCLVGHTMDSAMDMYGPDLMRDWRATADIPPDPIDPSSPHNPASEERYASLEGCTVPTTECLLDVKARVAQVWDKEIAPAIRSGKRVAIVAHENSLRALLMHIDPAIPADQVLKFEVPRATPLVYSLDPKTLTPRVFSDSALPLSGRLLLGDNCDVNAQADGCQLTNDGKGEVSMDAAAGFR